MNQSNHQSKKLHNIISVIKVFLAITVFSCQNTVSPNKDNPKTPDSAAVKVISENFNRSTYDTVGFLPNCQKLGDGAYEGYLQGVEANKDSLGNFCFYECYDCKETFQIIFIHKTRRGADTDNSMWNEFENGCRDNYQKFNCFAFVYPMRDPDKQKHVHAMNIDFPVTVKVYERTNGDSWKFLKKARARTFHELSLLEFKTIYHLQ